MGKSIIGWGCYFVLVLPLSLVVFYFWHQRVLGFFFDYDNDIDSIFSDCPTNSPDPDSNLAVVIPFSEDRFWNIYAQLFLWDFPNFSPISGEDKYKNRTLLIFYPYQNSEGLQTIIEHLIDEDEQIFQGFSQVTLFSRNLSSRYQKGYYNFLDGHIVTPKHSEMFYPFISDFAKKYFNATFAFYLDGGIFPARSGWLSRLQEIAFAPDSDFWLLGSPARYQLSPTGKLQPVGERRKKFKKRSKRFLKPIESVLVRTDNQCFNEILGKVHENYRYLPVMNSVMEFLSEPVHQREALHVLPHVRYTDFIRDIGNDNFDPETFPKNYPETYFIRGQKYIDYLNYLMKVERHKIGIYDIDSEDL